MTILPKQNGVGFPWFGQGDFQIDPNATPDEIKRRRDRLAQKRYGNAQYVGAGLADLATGIMSGVQRRKMSEVERTGREKASSLFGSLLRGEAPAPASSPTGPMTVLGIPEAEGGGYDDFNASLSHTESGGNYNVTNSEGFGGKYQFGQPRLDDFNRANGTQYKVADLTAGTPEARALTEAVQDWHVGDIDQFSAANGLDQYIGRNIGGVTITRNGMRAMAHLGGKGGMQKYLTSGGQYNPADSNGTRLSDYARTHAGGGVTMSTRNSPAQASQPDMSALYEAMANPWMNAEQKALIGQMIEQRMQASDPIRQMQLEKGRLELEALRNPPAPERKIIKGADGFQYYQDDGSRVLPDVQLPEKPKFSTVTGEEAAAIGLDPAKSYNIAPDGKISQIGGNGTNVTVNNGGQDAGWGKPPKDTVWLRDEGGQVVTEPDPSGRGVRPVSVPVVGSKAQREADEATQTESAAVSQAEDALKLIQSIIEDPNLPSITGNIQGRLPAGIPMITGGQDGADLSVKIKQLQGKAFLQAFETLKGGGQITEREGQAAQNAMARLATEQSEEAYIEALRELEGIVQRGLAKAQAGSRGADAAPPEGVDPDLWQYMTPEEKALFQ